MPEVKQGSPATGREPRAWLSFTHLDLAGHADAVEKALQTAGWSGVRAEGLPSADRPVIGEIRRAIRECDALVAIIAHRYGHVPSRKLGGDGRRSWVWLEVGEAEKHQIPVLVFMLDERVPWPSDYIDGSPAADRLKEFKAYLEERKLYKRFSSVEELTAQVIDALVRLRPETLAKPANTPGTENQEGSSSAGSSAADVPSPSPPERQWFGPGVDPLMLAWRLVIDRKADPDLLLHLDPRRALEAIERAERETSEPGSRPLDELLKKLESRQGGLQPNALWLAWMRQVQAARIDALTKAPPTRAPEPHQAPADTAPARGGRVPSKAQP